MIEKYTTHTGKELELDITDVRVRRSPQQQLQRAGRLAIGAYSHVLRPVSVQLWRGMVFAGRMGWRLGGHWLTHLREQRRRRRRVREIRSYMQGHRTPTPTTPGRTTKTVKRSVTITRVTVVRTEETIVHTSSHCHECSY